MDEIDTVAKLNESQTLRAAHMALHGSTDTEIAGRIGATIAAVAAWRGEWEELRTPQKPQGETSAVLALRKAEALERWRSRIGAETAALSVDALELARDAVNDGDARKFNDSARGIATMVQLARQAEGMDSTAKGDASSNLSVFVLRVGERGVEDLRPLKNVTPEAEPSFG